MNPAIDPAIIEEAYESDPEAARAEYGAEFRDDLADFITRETVDAVTCWGRKELPPEPGVIYAAFCDPSGGVSDAMTLAIGHLRDGNIGVLDALLEVRPPFDPDAAVAQCAELLRRFGVSISPAELRKRARQEPDRTAAARLQAIANALEGMTRAEAARLAGMERQALHDAVGRYNAEGLDGLHDRPRPGAKPRLDEEQMKQLRQVVLGQIMGTTAIGSTTYGFLDTNGHFTIFNVPGASGTTAMNLNNLDEIVGIWGQPVTFYNIAYLATLKFDPVLSASIRDPAVSSTPIPEASALTLFCVGFVGTGFIRGVTAWPRPPRPSVGASAPRATSASIPTRTPAPPSTPSPTSLAPSAAGAIRTTPRD